MFSCSLIFKNMKKDKCLFVFYIIPAYWGNTKVLVVDILHVGWQENYHQTSNIRHNESQNSSVAEKRSWFIRHLSDGLYIFYSNLWNLSSDIWDQPSEMSNMSDYFREHWNSNVFCHVFRALSRHFVLRVRGLHHLNFQGPQAKFEGSFHWNTLPILQFCGVHWALRQSFTRTPFNFQGPGALTSGPQRALRLVVVLAQSIKARCYC